MTESPSEAINAIKDALERATPGVWEVDDPQQVWAHAAREYVCITRWGDTPLPNFHENAAYIAACHPERIRALLEYVQGLESAAKTARELLVENLAAFGPCDHDVGICNCDIKRGIDELNDAVEAKG